jgi:hypothetical protein
MTDAETESFTRHVVFVEVRCCVMDSKLREWQLDIERIWSADTPDWREAARLADVMARISGEAVLRQAAAQALPILRRATLEATDPGITDAAQRRLGIIREVLHSLTTPKFGRRDIPVRQLTPEECHRQLLGLPLDRRLTLSEIHRAYKRVAKSAHPDAGGSAREFQAVSAAREALMKAR